MTCIKFSTPDGAGILCTGPMGATPNRKGRETADTVLADLQANGGKVDIFWCTEGNRPVYLRNLERAGKIRRVADEGYPVVRYAIEEGVRR